MARQAPDRPAEVAIKPAAGETPRPAVPVGRAVEVAQLPLVKKAMDVLGAQIFDLPEDFAVSDRHALARRGDAHVRGRRDRGMIAVRIQFAP